MGHDGRRWNCVELLPPFRRLARNIVHGGCVPFISFTFESFIFSDFLFSFFMECLDSQVLLLEERELDVLLMLDLLSLCVCFFFLLLEL